MKLIPEWYDHQYCLIAWPCNKDLYGKVINKAEMKLPMLLMKLQKLNM